MARRCPRPPPLWGRRQVGGKPVPSPPSQPSPQQGKGSKCPFSASPRFTWRLCPRGLLLPPTVNAACIPRFGAGVGESGACQPSAGVAEPERLQTGPMPVGVTPDEIFVDTPEALDYSPASLRWLCCFRLLHQPRIVLITVGPSDQKAEPVSPPQRRSPPMRQTPVIPSSTPTRFLARPQLLTRV